MFIYLIRNSQDGRCYIGKTARSVRERWLEHLRHARNNYKDGPLYEALRALPASAFEVATLYRARDQVDLNEAEMRFIVAFRAVETGYNCTEYSRGGLDSNGRTIRRKRLSKVQRKRISRGVSDSWKEGRRVPDRSALQATA